jgi:hypothetical protein
MPRDFMFRKVFLYGAALLSPIAGAEDFVCTYRWTDADTAIRARLIVDEGAATLLGDEVDVLFIIVSNTPDELLGYKAFTRQQNGSDYPVGLSVIVLDRRTGTFTYSHTFAGSSQNNRADGECAGSRPAQRGQGLSH